MIPGLAPLAELTVWSLLLSFIIVLVYRFLGPKPAAMRAFKEEQKAIKVRMDAAKKAGRTEETNKLVSESLALQNKHMKGSFKPMLVSLLVFALPLYFWFPEVFKGMVIVLPFALPVLGPDVSWLGWYILISVPSNFAFRRLLGMELS